MLIIKKSLLAVQYFHKCTCIVIIEFDIGVIIIIISIIIIIMYKIYSYIIYKILNPTHVDGKLKTILNYFGKKV